MNMNSHTTHHSINFPSRQTTNDVSQMMGPPKTAPNGALMTGSIAIRSHSIDAGSHLNTRLILKEKLK